MADAMLLIWLLGAPQQLKPTLFMLPMWLSFMFAVSATLENTHTHIHMCTHTNETLKESFLSLLNEENNNMKDCTPKVSHMKIKLMTL